MLERSCINNKVM